MNVNPNGKLVVISGPSGAGKSTVVRKLLETCQLPLVLSISATTRAPRPGEVNGQHYEFMSREEFQAKKETDEFLEYAEVFGRGEWYGTLRRPVTDHLAQGKTVILEIDVAGARQVMERFPDVVTIFVHPGSLEILEKRLRGRGTETEAKIQRRLEVARVELESASLYQHVVHNEDVDTAVNEICHLLTPTGESKTCTKN